MTPGDDEDQSLAQNLPRSVGVGDVIRDRFVLEAELGSGGMGRVFKALDLRRQEARDRHPYVAVKLLTHSFRQHPASLMALQREARRAQTLAHPNIISVFDFDRDGSLVYLIMEYLRGRTLNDILIEPGFSGLASEEAMQIIGQVGEALKFAHAHGIVHSDLKPSNIFLTDDGRVDDGRVKVIDFGIARAFRRPDTPSGEATLFDASSLRAFSPLYASPEMIDGDEEADPRDDVFSLACITYELICGKHPFGGKSAAIARNKRHELQKPANLTRPQWAALRRGLAFSRAERTATIESFLIGLDLRPPRKNLRLRAAHRTAAAASFLAQLDPRPVWRSLRLRVGRAAPTIASFLVRLDPRPVWTSLRLRVGRAVVAIGPLLARLDPRPALNKPRLLAASIAVVISVAGGLIWLTGPGPERTTVDPVAPGQVEPPQEPTPAAPAPMPPPPDEARAKEDRPSAFLDCDQCPELIAIPAGRFQMGAPETDADAEPEEKPRREVAIDEAFALGRYEVSEREWAACANDAACRNVRPASATVLADSPKTHVTWQDTQDFLRWLNGKTGQSYRLPSEAEWEYAARAGADSRYPWGDEIGVNNANCRDCGAPMGGLTSSPVGSFAPNGFGLFDMIGNVWEWTADCGGTRRATSKDGSCAQRVVRGGSWANSAAAVRVTQRLSVRADIREDNVGFRVARDLP